MPPDARELRFAWHDCCASVRLCIGTHCAHKTIAETIMQINYLAWHNSNKAATVFHPEVGRSSAHLCVPSHYRGSAL